MPGQALAEGQARVLALRHDAFDAEGAGALKHRCAVEVAGFRTGSGHWYKMSV
jgi:hypothetical protein